MDDKNENNSGVFARAEGIMTLAQVEEQKKQELENKGDEGKGDEGKGNDEDDDKKKQADDKKKQADDNDDDKKNIEGKNDEDGSEDGKGDEDKDGDGNEDDEGNEGNEGKEKGDDDEKGKGDEGKGDDDGVKKAGEVITSLFEKAGVQNEEEFVNKFNSQLDELNKTRTENEQLKAKQEEFGNVDPIKEWFNDNEALYKVAKMMQENESIDPSLALKLMNNNVDEISDYDALKYNILLDMPNVVGGESGIKEMIMTDFGIRPESLPEDFEFDNFDFTRDFDKLSYGLQNKIKNEARKAKNRIKELGSSVELPDARKNSETRKKEIEEKQSAFKKSWDDVLPVIAKDITKKGIGSNVEAKLEDGTIIKDGLVYNVGDDFENKVLDGLSDQLSKSGVEPTKENMVQIGQKMYDYARNESFEGMLNKVFMKGYQLGMEKILGETHNARQPGGKNKQPEGKSKPDNMDSKMMNSVGARPQKMNPNDAI